MCGIVGYIGEDASRKVFEGLKMLEYRGYDSCGIASVDEGKLFLAKEKGRISGLQFALDGLNGKVAIGHTRWATHGKPSTENAHPHVSGKFAVVHNGIIENATELKRGFDNFISQTDSEVIVKLVEKYSDKNTLLALQKATQMLVGAYAIGLVKSDENKIYIAKKHSPIVVGMGKNCAAMSSDVSTLSEFAEKYYILKDGEFAVLSQDEIEIFDCNLNKKCVEMTECVKTQKGKCCEDGTQMLEEIKEIPKALENTMLSYQNLYRDGAISLLKNAREIVFVGCGTAYHAAKLGEWYFSEIADVSVKTFYASEFRYLLRPVREGSVVVAVSQSGETADTLSAVAKAKTLGAKTLAITNSPLSAMVGACDFSIITNAGVERAVAATKSFDAQVAVLNALACDLLNEREENKLLKRQINKTFLKTL